MSHYEVLGCHPASSHDEIKKAYYKSARKYHPDKNDGKDDEFKKVVQAYTVLSDPKKKFRYDLTLPRPSPQEMGVTLEEITIGTEKELRFMVDVYSGSLIRTQREQILHVTIPAKSWPGRTIYSGQTPVVLKVIDLSGCSSYNDGVLYYRYRLNIFKALLGLDEELTIIGEKRHLFHPDPVTPMSEIIIPDAGVYRSNGERGPLSIIFEIEFPKDLQSDQRRLISECLDYEEKKKILASS